uniref:Uncharacterized protein n=1 Tax=Anopheles dirus TaxID=7168 RepID=A0A182NWN5_9DIPT
KCDSVSTSVSNRAEQYSRQLSVRRIHTNTQNHSATQKLATRLAGQQFENRDNPCKQKPNVQTGI